ncbi:MAG: hypothetical protein JW807_00830 [Spirochaetes bacterium]|nr:hypothetical protein [Spirochaetota bacterium]
MDFDWKLVVQGVMLLLTVSAIYWRLHYHQKSTGDTIIEHDCELKEHEKKLSDHDKEIAGLKSDMNVIIREIEYKIDKKLADRDAKFNRRLQRIEKILIRMDERLKTQAAGELVEEDG